MYVYDYIDVGTTYAHNTPTLKTHLGAGEQTQTLSYSQCKLLAAGQAAAGNSCSL